MSERHWVESLYETSALRDVVGYGGPGSLLLGGLLCELESKELLKHVISYVPGFIAFLAAAYIAAIGLRVIGTTLPILVFHRGCGVLGRPESKSAALDWKTRIERILWRGDEHWLRTRYSALTTDQLRTATDREALFMHICGMTAMSLLILACAMLSLPNDGLARWLNIPEYQAVLALFASSAVFLLGHYRHALQFAILISYKAG